MCKSQVQFPENICQTYTAGNATSHSRDCPIYIYIYIYIYTHTHTHTYSEYLSVTLMFCDTKDLLVRKQLACLKELPTSKSVHINKQWHLLMQCGCVTPMKRTGRQETIKIDLVQQRLSEMLFGSLCLTRMYGILTRLQVGRLSNRGSITGRGNTITRPLVGPTQPFTKPYWRLFPGG